MLVLSRKPGEKILIGEFITVTVVRIGPNTVRLGIDAPRDLNIVRAEIAAGQDAPHGESGAHALEIELPLEALGDLAITAGDPGSAPAAAA
jgi:carbon storage regulator